MSSTLYYIGYTYAEPNKTTFFLHYVGYYLETQGLYLEAVFDDPIP